MYNRNTVLALCVVVMLPVAFLGSTIPTDAQFIVAVNPWTYLDDYGQGLIRVDLLWTNGTTYDYCGWFHPYTEFRDMVQTDWFYNTTLDLHVAGYINGTYLGFSGWETGLGYVRQSLTVTENGVTVLSQQNFTYYMGLDDAIAPMYYYVWHTNLTLFTTHGASYRLTIDFEVFDTNAETEP